MSDQTDVTLIKQVLSGRKECYRPLVEKYRKIIYHIGFTLLRNISEAQDITQETFLIAYKNLRELKDRKKFGSWLYGIARNLCYETLRKKRIEPELIHEIMESEKFNVVEMRPSDPNGEDLLESLLNKLESLPEKYRVLLYLKYLEDYSYMEIAEMLDLPVDLVRSRLFEGRRLLREGVLSSRSIDYGV